MLLRGEKVKLSVVNVACSTPDKGIYRILIFISVKEETLQANKTFIVNITELQFRRIFHVFRDLTS